MVVRREGCGGLSGAGEGCGGQETVRRWGPRGGGAEVEIAAAARDGLERKWSVGEEWESSRCRRRWGNRGVWRCCVKW